MHKRPIDYVGVEGPVQGEIFVLYIQDDEIRLTGPCGAAPWLVELHEEDDPVDTVTRMVKSNLGDPAVVHSTSWRRSRDAVILSFVVVVSPAVAGDAEWARVGRSELARGEASAAPASVEFAQVIEHGLRHLAWLVRDDPVVASELSDGWKDVLADFVPEPFRHLR
jgi:hypothetical protein